MFRWLGFPAGNLTTVKRKFSTDAVASPAILTQLFPWQSLPNFIPRQSLPDLGGEKPIIGSKLIFLNLLPIKGLPPPKSGEDFRGIIGIWDSGTSSHTWHFLLFTSSHTWHFLPQFLIQKVYTGEGSPPLKMSFKFSPKNIPLVANPDVRKRRGSKSKVCNCWD